MNALSLIVALCCVAVAFGYQALDGLNSLQCVEVTQQHFLNARQSAWKQTKPSDVSGYYVRRNNNLYTKVNDVNCDDIKDLKRMFLKRSGGAWMAGRSARFNSGSAIIRSCKKAFPGYGRMAVGVCARNIILSVDSAPMSKCNTPWKTTSDYSSTMRSSVLPAPAMDAEQPDADFQQPDTKGLDEPVDVDGDDEPVNDDQPVEEEPVVDDEPVNDDEQPLDDDEPVNDDEMPLEDDQPVPEEPLVDDDIDEPVNDDEQPLDDDETVNDDQPMDDEPIDGDNQPNDDESVFDDEFPEDVDPIFDEPVTDPNAVTFTLGPNTLLIVALVMANSAVIMAILYRREKERNQKLIDFQ